MAYQTVIENALDKKTEKYFRNYMLIIFFFIKFVKSGIFLGGIINLRTCQ